VTTAQMCGQSFGSFFLRLLDWSPTEKTIEKENKMIDNKNVYIAAPEDVDPDELEAAITAATEKADEAIGQFWRSMEGRPDLDRFATYVASNLVIWIKCRVHDFADEWQVLEREALVEHVTNNPGVELDTLYKWAASKDLDADSVTWLLGTGRLQQRRRGVEPLVVNPILG
jgi:hypothetical protein